MRYPGGKGKCFQHIINHMPPHATYIESHLGGGAVLRHKLPAPRTIGIERDGRVMLAHRGQLPASVELVEGDAVDFLNAFTFRGDELIYSDPPYVAETRRTDRIYRYEYSRNDHIRLLETLLRVPCMVVISGYDNDLYREALHTWRTSRFMAKTHVDMREETLWLNFPKPITLHDTRYLGETFRERQGIQRRRSSLRQRVARMDALERTEFMRWLSKTFEAEMEEALCSLPL